MNTWNGLGIDMHSEDELFKKLKRLPIENLSTLWYNNFHYWDEKYPINTWQEFLKWHGYSLDEFAAHLKVKNGRK